MLAFVSLGTLLPPQFASLTFRLTFSEGGQLDRPSHTVVCYVAPRATTAAAYIYACIQSEKLHMHDEKVETVHCFYSEMWKKLQTEYILYGVRVSCIHSKIMTA